MIMKYSKNFYQIKSNQDIFNKIVEEKASVGYYNLPYEPIEDILDYANTITKKHIVVVGIGGSSLGTRAIYEFLRPSNDHLKPLLFLDTIDPLEINYQIKQIDLQDSHFVFVSKSGNTIEVVSLLKYLHSLTEIDSSNATVISEAQSKLTAYANSNNIKAFNLAENIGGRFSVFSSVGLLPLAMAGVDIKNLLEGCKSVNNSFFKQEEYFGTVFEKARFYVENKTRFHTNVVFSYSSALKGFNKWYVQLWAESLGKLNINGTRQGLTPVGLIGPDDQHSYLQLIVDGVRDKSVTFIKVADRKDSSQIPTDTSKYFAKLDGGFTEGFSFNELLNRQADATIQSISKQGDIPYDVLTIRTVDEFNIGSLMFVYQLLTSCIGAFLQINTYDQPGVEHGKKHLKESIKEEISQ